MLRYTKFALLAVLLSNTSHAGIVGNVVGGAVAGTIVSDGIKDAAKQVAPQTTVTTSGEAIDCQVPSSNGCEVTVRPASGTFSHDSNLSMSVNLTYAEYVSYTNQIPLPTVVVTRVTRVYGEHTHMVIEYTVKDSK